MDFWSRIFVDSVKYVARNTMEEDTYEKFSTILFIIGVILTIGFASGFLYILYLFNDGKPLF